MASYRRLIQPGATWFFTLTTEGRKPLLVLPDSLQAMAHAVIQVRTRYPFGIVAWVVLPDHLHAIVRLPDGDAGYAQRISIFKRLVSQRLTPPAGSVLRDSMRKRRELGIWQRRFWEHLVRDETDLHRHLDYIHYNPVKHGCVPRAADWPHSSFRQYARAGLLPADWAAVPEDHSRPYGE